MTKSNIQTMIIDSFFEVTRDIKPEMDILKIIFTEKSVWLIYKEYSQGLKTTLNHMENALDRIGFIYLHGYCEDIKKELNSELVYVNGADGDYIVDCCYDLENKISTFYIKLNRWLK